MIDHHTQQRQAWLKTKRAKKDNPLWDVLAVILGAAAFFLAFFI